MKKTITVVLAMIVSASLTVNAFDIKDALKGLKGGSGDNTAGTIAGVLGNILSTDKLELSQLEGEWHYSAPAVTFVSDNVLKKVGGAAASTVITDKLASIYKTCGITDMTLTIDSVGEFSMKLRKLTLKGTITPFEKEGSQANFEFNFSAGSIKLGKMNAYVEKTVTGDMKLTFDVSKLISLVSTVSKVSGNNSLKTISSVLENYDGLCAGFELKKQ